MNEGTYYSVAREYTEKTGQHFAGKSALEMMREMNELRAEMNHHAPACTADRKKEFAERQEYKARWPGYCRKCGGEGGHSDYEYRGEFHGAPASEQVYDSCPACIEQLKCPRCGIENKNNFWMNTVIYRDEKAKCYVCGWTEGMPGCPEVMNPYDCGCDDTDPETYPIDGAY